MLKSKKRTRSSIKQERAVSFGGETTEEVKEPDSKSERTTLLSRRMHSLQMRDSMNSQIRKKRREEPMCVKWQDRGIMFQIFVGVTGLLSSYTIIFIIVIYFASEFYRELLSDQIRMKTKEVNEE